MMAEAGGPFINPERLDLRKYASRPTLSRALMDYILYVDHNVKRGAELAALAVAASKEGGAAAAGGARLGRSGAKDEDDGEGADWWWRGRLGKCYYQLGLLRDAERQFLLSLKQQVCVKRVSAYTVVDSGSNKCCKQRHHLSIVVGYAVVVANESYHRHRQQRCLASVKACHHTQHDLSRPHLYTVALPNH